MRATYADFKADPPTTGNSTVQVRGCRPADGHLAVGTGGEVALDFVPDEGETPQQLTLTVTALVSPLGKSVGHAPMEVTVNGRVVVAEFTVPGGAAPRETAFAVPGAWLVPGTNTLHVRSSAAARGTLRLHRITLEVSDVPRISDASAEAAGTEAQEADQGLVLSFRTERRGQGHADWTTAPPLTVHLGRGDGSPPAQLAWRGQDGAEAAVVLDSASTAFYGHHRAADGALAEYRGTLEERAPLDGSGYRDRVRRFRTEENRGGEWHTSDELRLLVDDGTTPVERVTWHDMAGNSGSLTLRAAGPDPAAEVTGLVTSVRASDEFTTAGEFAANLLDGTRHKWLAHAHRASLEFTLERPSAVRHYELVSANDAADRDPTDWVFQGSHDGEHWTTLDRRAAERFPERHQPRGFTLPEAAPYLHHRLEITRNAGACQTQLSQVRFFTSAPRPRGFAGYHQRAGEDVVGYRGTSVPGSVEREPEWRPVPDPEPVDEPEVVEPPAGGWPRTVEQWRSYLGQHSADFLQVADGEEPDDVDALRSAVGRLLFGGADEERIAALEKRLGTRLPPGYRAFLATSDRRVNLGPFTYEMRTTETVDWFRAESGLWEMLRMGGEEGFEEQTAMMDRALLISEDCDAMYWLLDPGDVSPDGEWAAYVWASWYPGLGERHASFAELVAEERAGFDD